MPAEFDSQQMACIDHYDIDNMGLAYGEKEALGQAIAGAGEELTEYMRAAGLEVYQAGKEEPLCYNKENLLNPWFVVEPKQMK